MPEQQGFDPREGRLWQPLLFAFLFAATVYGMALALAPVVGMPYPEIALAFSLPFFLISLHTTRRLQRIRNKRPSRVMESGALFLLWAALCYLLLPGLDISFADFPRANYFALGGGLLALISWRFAAARMSELELPHLIPYKRQQLGKAFHEWAHNFLQGQSVGRTVNRLKARAALLLLLFLLSSVLDYRINNRSDARYMWLALVAVPAALALFSNLYKFELYTRWITQHIRVGFAFLGRWLRFSLLFIAVLLLLALIPPRQYPILSWEGAVAMVKGLFSRIYQSGKPDYERINREARERQRQEELKRLQESSRRLLEQNADQEHPLRLLLRLFAWLALMVLLLALLGGLLKRRYRYRRPPPWTGLPIMLWGLLQRFLALFAFFVRLLLRLFPGLRVRRKPHIRDELRRDLEAMLTRQREHLSQDKLREIRTIIDIYISYLEAAAERGIRYRTGQTPNEFRTLLAGRVPGLERDATELTGIFYRCRYSRELMGTAQIARARSCLHGCSKVLAQLDLAEGR